MHGYNTLNLGKRLIYHICRPLDLNILVERLWLRHRKIRLRLELFSLTHAEIVQNSWYFIIWLKSNHILFILVLWHNCAHVSWILIYLHLNYILSFSVWQWSLVLNHKILNSSGSLKILEISQKRIMIGSFLKGVKLGLFFLNGFDRFHHIINGW